MVKDSTNTAIITGNDNRVIQKASQPKPVEVLPYDGNERVLFPFGRWIMRVLFHGDMTHSLIPYTLGISILSAIEFYFAFGRIWLDPNFLPTLAGSSNLYIELVPLFALAITAFYGWGVIGISGETTCPKCHQKFMFTRKRRHLTGQGTHQGFEVTNYKSKYSCDNCGYSESVSEVVERAIPAEEE